jgi:hypothetical protein
VRYKLLLPAPRGREKRLFFNTVSGGIVLGFGLGGALAGFARAEVISSGVGLAAGLGLGGSLAERHRFCRRGPGLAPGEASVVIAPTSRWRGGTAGARRRPRSASADVQAAPRPVGRVLA